MDGKLFRHSTDISIIDVVVRLVYLLNSNAWYDAFSRSLVVHLDSSIIPTCSFFSYMFSKSGIEDVPILFCVELVASMVVCYLETSCIIFFSSSALMNDFSAFGVSGFTKRNFIFPVIVRNNIKPFRLKMSGPCRGVGFCVYMILEEVKVFSQFFNALLVYFSSFYLVCIMGVDSPYI